MLVAINPVALLALRIAATFFPADQFARRDVHLCCRPHGSWLHALRKEALQIGVKGAVVPPHDVPARLRLPRGAFFSAAGTCMTRFS